MRRGVARCVVLVGGCLGGRELVGAVLVGVVNPVVIRGGKRWRAGWGFDLVSLIFDRTMVA